MSKKLVRFPVYFQVCGYQTMELPDDLDAEDEDAVKEYIDDHWPDVALPKETEYVGDDGFDFESIIEIIDNERLELERRVTNYLYTRQEMVPELLGKEICAFGGRKLFAEHFLPELKTIPTDQIKAFMAKHYGKHKRNT